MDETQFKAILERRRVARDAAKAALEAERKEADAKYKALDDQLLGLLNGGTSEQPRDTEPGSETQPVHGVH